MLRVLFSNAKDMIRLYHCGNHNHLFTVTSNEYCSSCSLFLTCDGILQNTDTYATETTKQEA